MSIRDVFVSVIVPCCDDTADILGATESVLTVLNNNYDYFELVIVDDTTSARVASSMANILKRYESIRYIRLSRKYSVDIVVSAGLDSAIGDFVVVMDPLIDPPAMIPEIVSQCHKNPGVHYGVISTKQYSFHSGIIRNAFSSVFDWYCKKFMLIDIQRKSLLFRVFSRQAVNIFTQMRDRSRLLRLMSANLGLPTYPFEYAPIRNRGLIPPRKIFDDIDFAFDILVATSRQPLRLVSRIGVLLALFNLIYALYVLAVFFFKSHVAEGWVTVSIQSAVMFFFLFAVLAILGEYVGKVVFEGQQRSLYTILEECNSSVLVNEESRRNIVVESEKENH